MMRKSVPGIVGGGSGVSVAVCAVAVAVLAFCCGLVDSCVPRSDDGGVMGAGWGLAGSSCSGGVVGRS